MSNANDVRKAHELLDELDARAELSQEQEKLLRSFLPERPKQKTLEETTERVYDAWIGASDNEWGGNSYNPDISLEDWLSEMYAQLKGLKDAPANAPAHPEFLETEADYQNAPEGTVVAEIGRLALVKEGDDDWTCGGGANSDYSMALVGSRRVLRWGWQGE